MVPDPFQRFAKVRFTGPSLKRFCEKKYSRMTQDRLEQIIKKYGLDALQAIQNAPDAFEFAGASPRRR